MAIPKLVIVTKFPEIVSIIDDNRFHNGMMSALFWFSGGAASYLFLDRARRRGYRASRDIILRVSSFSRSGGVAGRPIEVDACRTGRNGSRARAGKGEVDCRDAMVGLAEIEGFIKDDDGRGEHRGVVRKTRQYRRLPPSRHQVRHAREMPIIFIT